MKELKAAIENKIAYHTLFWLVFILISSIEDLVYYSQLQQNVQANITLVMLFLPAVYFNLYYLIPRFLLTKRYLLYGSTWIALLVAGTFCINWFFSNIYGRTFYDSRQGFMVTLADCLMLMLLTTAIRFVKNLYSEQKKIKDLQQRNFEMELQLLHNQVNPHMFFNTLNNIYFLIDKDAAIAKKTILRFSDLLSHQLYDNKKDKIELQKEIGYIQNFIELETLRQGDVVQVSFDFPDNLNGERISPMLLLPFVENAFKHGNKTAPEGYKVRISIFSWNKHLYFMCANTFCGPGKLSGKGGLGQENVKRRLELLYPGRHSLSISRTLSEYVVELKLYVDED